jgi:ribonuclease BN (tRNA processing enzyme)
MSKITLLGTCSGTEPMPNMHHCSLLFDINDSLYWFDCGEGAVYNAYTDGVDFLKTRAVFVSHMHFDHIGSLSHLIFTIQKMYAIHKKALVYGDSIDFYLPDTSLFEAIKGIAGSSRNYRFKFGMNEFTVTDGIVYKDENICVTAHHNTHLKENGENGWHSYSYLIEALGKRIVFSGDVGAPEELDELIGEGCDVLIIETGHHKVKNVLSFAEARNVGKLYFNHHGREILEDREAAKALAKSSSVNAVIASDGEVIEL